MLFPLLVLLASLLVLGKASEWVIERAVTVAHFLRISELAVGFFLLAIATSLPELSVGITGSLSGNPEISVGNVLGANISDMTLVLALTALTAPILLSKSDKEKIKRIILSAVFLPFLLLLPLGKITGLIFLIVFAVFSFFIFKEPVSFNGKTEKIGGKKAFVAVIFLAMGFLLIIASADFAVKAASEVSFAFGVSQAFIAATIVSIGTTLPELGVAIAGVRKKKYGMVVGNALGSCAVNLGMVLGISGLIAPLSASFSSIAYLLVFTLVAGGALFCIVQYKKSISKKEAALLLGVYLLFLIAATVLEKFP